MTASSSKLSTLMAPKLLKTRWSLGRGRIQLFAKRPNNGELKKEGLRSFIVINE